MHPHKIMQLQLHNRIPNCRSRTLPVIHTTPKYTCHLNMTSQIFLPLSKQRSQPAKVKKCNNTSLEGKYMLVAQSCVQTPSKLSRQKHSHLLFCNNAKLSTQAESCGTVQRSPVPSILPPGDDQNVKVVSCGESDLQFFTHTQPETFFFPLPYRIMIIAIFQIFFPHKCKGFIFCSHTQAGLAVNCMFTGRAQFFTRSSLFPASFHALCSCFHHQQS